MDSVWGVLTGLGGRKKHFQVSNFLTFAPLYLHTLTPAYFHTRIFSHAHIFTLAYSHSRIFSHSCTLILTNSHTYIISNLHSAHVSCYPVPMGDIGVSEKILTLHSILIFTLLLPKIKRPERQIYEKFSHSILYKLTRSCFTSETKENHTRIDGRALSTNIQTFDFMIKHRRARANSVNAHVSKAHGCLLSLNRRKSF